MAVLLDERPAISVNDVEIVGVNFADHLYPGEIITGIPSVVEVNTDVLTISDILINTESYVEAYTSEVVGAGEAVLFLITGDTAGDYTIRVEVDTDPLESTAYTPASRHIIRDLVIRLK